MRAAPGAARSLFVACTILVAAHVTLLVFDPRALFFSNLFNIMYPLLGVMVCLLGAYRQSPETRPLWLLFGCGLLVAAVGEIGLTYYDFGAHIHTQTQALNSDFFFLLTQFLSCWLSAPGIRTRRTEELRMARWGSSALATMLAYLQLFSILPSHARPEAISATNLLHLNDAGEGGGRRTCSSSGSRP
jgi:hypothetical protein